MGCSASLVCQTHCTEEAGINSNVLTQTIVTGSDPRGLPEFSAIREEINKASHPSQPELNWKLVESLALAIFKANGVDLHTATYYTLARTRTQGLAGFCEGAELLAAMVSHDWDKFWPQGGPARTEMLDWFNSRTGNILRQQISFAESDLPLIYRTERALQLICDKLQQVELKRVPRVENLLYFMQNTRKRLEQQQASTQWNEALKTRAQSSPQLRGWLQTRQDLHAFADLVMQREKEGLTLSYIKNVIWQAERGLGQETPVESLLTQYHDARAQKQNTDALEKQINERLEGVLSRWLLLKNNVMPEAATGTTAEK